MSHAYAVPGAAEKLVTEWTVVKWTLSGLSWIEKFLGK